ncbi:protein of unknown function [Methylorubrum extorquens]|uniref:Transposase n=1 Tax=Methylorubrum extorquens TaxID=408 RepID=A0A2N9AWN2_METEX|nr:protein of unknown function [Methylorubrum extorquens]
MSYRCPRQVGLGTRLNRSRVNANRDTLQALKIFAQAPSFFEQKAGA